MKTSNKIFFGGLATLLFIGIFAAGLSRANTKVITAEECEKMPRSKKNLNLEFTKIEAAHKINVVLSQGDFDVDLECAKELMPFVNHHVEDGILKLYIDENNDDNVLCPVDFKIQCPNLTSIRMQNGSRIRTEGRFTASNISITAQNGSQVEMELESEQVKTVSQNGANVQLKGIMRRLDLNAVNGARVNAAQAEISSAVVSMANSASATIKADTIYRASLSNSATLDYIGSTVLEDIQTNNSSSIRKKGMK